MYSMRSQKPTLRATGPVTDRDPDVVARGKCRCALVRGWHTEGGWLLEPVEHRDRWYKVVTMVRPHDSILVEGSVDDWETSSPLNVWCRHGVSAPDVAHEVRRWRPRHAAA